MDVLARVCRLAALLIVLSIVLSPLRAMAAALHTSVPTVSVAGPIATTLPGSADTVRREPDEASRNNTYDATFFGYDDPSNSHVGDGAGAVRAHDGATEHAERRELRGEGAISDGPATTTAAEAAPMAQAPGLFHYTTEEGMNAILESGELNPSLKALNPADARYGNGQYLTDVVPGSASADSLSARFLGVPRQGARFSNYVEIDTTGLNVIQGRKGVFLVPNEGPLDISGRIMSFGEGY